VVPAPSNLSELFSSDILKGKLYGQTVPGQTAGTMLFLNSADKIYIDKTVITLNSVGDYQE
jgi:hypothetical protein